MAKDPICGMEVDEGNAIKFENKGETYFFCSQHCKDKFVKKQGGEQKAASHCCHSKHEKVKSKGGHDFKYVCPMHPDIGSSQPGDCTKCGMPQIGRAHV